MLQGWAVQAAHPANAARDSFEHNWQLCAAAAARGGREKHTSEPGAQDIGPKAAAL